MNINKFGEKSFIKPVPDEDFSGGFGIEVTCAAPEGELRALMVLVIKRYYTFVKYGKGENLLCQPMYFSKPVKESANNKGTSLLHNLVIFHTL